MRWRAPRNQRRGSKRGDVPRVVGNTPDAGAFYCPALKRQYPAASWTCRRTAGLVPAVPPCRAHAAPGY
jgi:hypothetical protein